MVLESTNEGNVHDFLDLMTEKTKNSISANDWVEFRKHVKEFDESDLKVFGFIPGQMETFPQAHS